jgi:hypothetical protein
MAINGTRQLHATWTRHAMLEILARLTFALAVCVAIVVTLIRANQP